MIELIAQTLRQIGLCWEGIDPLLVGPARDLVCAIGRLSDGREPEAPRRAASYRVRGGGALTSAKFSFEEVMRARFGSTTGRVDE